MENEGGPARPKSAAPSSTSPSTKKRLRREPPIIIVPDTPHSLITMLNAKDILEDQAYVTNEQKRAEGAKRLNEVSRNEPNSSFLCGSSITFWGLRYRFSFTERSLAGVTVNSRIRSRLPRKSLVWKTGTGLLLCSSLEKLGNLKAGHGTPIPLKSVLDVSVPSLLNMSVMRNSCIFHVRFSSERI